MWSVLKAAALYAVFCFVFIIAIPMAISILEVRSAMQRFPGSTITATLLLALCTAFGLWFALTIRRNPYRTTRMVVATVGQGAAMGIALGSVPVLAYVAVAGLMWFLLRKR